jgi:MOSC domain-containing protein YiiM
MRAVITTIFAAKTLGEFPANGTPTGIFKQPVSGRVAIATEGLVCDRQADRRIHGGPEKAVHHYNAGHYPVLAGRFSEAAARFVPGSIGENFSSAGLDEQTVAIGDVLSMGSTRLQVAQPRSPCWKIDARFGVKGVGNFVSDSCYQGWYYRVLEPGEVEAGDELVLLDRNPDPVWIAEFWRGWRERPPSIDKLVRFLATPGLAAVWHRYLKERLELLRATPPEQAPEVPAVYPKF